MKTIIRSIALILALSLLCAVPVSAEENAAPYASSYFSATRTYLYGINSERIGIWFELIARHDMEELGVSIITMQKSADGTSWQNVKTYYAKNYSVMTTEDDYYYANAVAYIAEGGYYYRAHVQFYAKDSGGTGYYNAYTSKMYFNG